MAKSKKSRKVGLIGVPKTHHDRADGAKKKRVDNKKPKNRKGLKPGHRQHLSEEHARSDSLQKPDPRKGSKEPVNLDKYRQPSKDNNKKQSIGSKQRYHSPMEELEAIENNKQLEQLLLKQEHTKLSAQELQFVEKLTIRYAQLCDMLGIDTDESENEKNIDPFANLDAIKLDDYKD